jgi:hypothetical protein
MIQEIKCSWNDKRTENKNLKDKGYISATAMSGMHSDQVHALGIDPKKLMPAWQLKNLAEVSESLRCYRLNIDGVKSYWYKIHDLAQIFGV